MSCTNLPLHWESTSDQYWFASPADWAAATGHYDLLRHLLLSDPTLFLSLTSLRRLRRLHSLWDSDPLHSSAAAQRSSAARRLFLECGPSLLSSGHGPWLLYSAAAAADFTFAAALLRRRPHLVFGEAEYGLSDLLYAAAAGRDLSTFFLLLDHALSPVFEGRKIENCKEFTEEVVNRGVHAACRGGSWEIVGEVLRRFGGGADEVLAFRDVGGATILHSAAARGQVEVIEGLLKTYDVIFDARDQRGNAAIHVAAFRGHAAAVEALIRAEPLSAYFTNNDGDTALHVAIAGFKAPGFRRLDRQLEVVKALIAVDSGKLANEQNNQGRTALHVAAAENVHADAMKLLTGAPSVNAHVKDVNGLTMFDLLRRQRRRRKGGASELWKIVSKTGIESLKDAAARSAVVAQMRESQTLISPGTSFRVHDSEILLLCGVGGGGAALSVDSTLEEEEIEEESF